MLRILVWKHSSYVPAKLADVGNLKSLKLKPALFFPALGPWLWALTFAAVARAERMAALVNFIVAMMLGGGYCQK